MHESSIGTTLHFILKIYIYFFFYHKQLFCVIRRLAIIRANASTLLAKKETFSVNLMRQLFLLVLNRHEQDGQNSYTACNKAERGQCNNATYRNA